MQSLRRNPCRSMLVMAARHAAAGVFVVALHLAPTTAFADSYCGPGRHVGAENDGAGQSWKCVADTAARTLSSVPSGSAAGLQGAAAGLQGAAAILSIVSGLGSLISSTDSTAGMVGNLDADTLKARSRSLNSQAIGAMREGQFDRAASLFDRAGLDALAADDDEGYKANIKNANIANAEYLLAQGYAWEQKGDFAKASQFYLQGKQSAQSAGALDLANKLATYNNQLLARAGGANGGVTATAASCVNINGQSICR